VMIGRLILAGLMLVAAAGGGYVLHMRTAPDPAAAPVVHRSTRPTIEQVRELASLVTLDVPISDTQVSKLKGFVGGVELILSVHGDVQIATDLSQARFDRIDERVQSATLTLPRPLVQRPRIDHEKTRILEITRGGMWRLVPGQAGESALINQAMLTAQHMLADTATDPKLITQARDHTEKIVCGFFATLDWRIDVQWDDAVSVSDASTR